MHPLPGQPKYQREGIMHDGKLANQTPRRKAGRGEESSRFLKKAAQKLLLRWAAGVVGDKAHDPA
jgi:hypothetical protein